MDRESLNEGTSKDNTGEQKSDRGSVGEPRNNLEMNRANATLQVRLFLLLLARERRMGRWQAFYHKHPWQRLRL